MRKRSEKSEAENQPYNGIRQDVAGQSVQGWYYYPEPIPKKAIPVKYRPMGAWKYLGYSILFGLPIIGFIFIIIFSLDGDNINRRSFARYHLLSIVLGSLILIGFIVLIALFVFSNADSSFFEEIAAVFQEMFASLRRIFGEYAG